MEFFKDEVVAEKEWKTTAKNIVLVFADGRVTFVQWSFVCLMKFTHLAHDIPGTSPEGSLNIVMSRTYRGPSRDPQRTNTKTNGKIVF